MPYTDYYIDKHIYLVYEGNKHFDMKISPVEIFKLDFTDLLYNYKPDRYVYSISINKKEDTLYCASFVRHGGRHVI